MVELYRETAEKLRYNDYTDIQPADSDSGINDIIGLEDKIKELDNAIEHLERSNRELKEFDPDSKDPTCVEAITENIAAIATKKNRKEKYQQKLQSQRHAATPTRSNDEFIKQLKLSAAVPSGDGVVL